MTKAPSAAPDKSDCRHGDRPLREAQELTLPGSAVLEDASTPSADSDEVCPQEQVLPGTELMRAGAVRVTIQGHVEVETKQKVSLATLAKLAVASATGAALGGVIAAVLLHLLWQQSWFLELIAQLSR